MQPCASATVTRCVTVSHVTVRRLRVAAAVLQSTPGPDEMKTKLLSGLIPRAKLLYCMQQTQPTGSSGKHASTPFPCASSCSSSAAPQRAMLSTPLSSRRKCCSAAVPVTRDMTAVWRRTCDREAERGIRARIRNCVRAVRHSSLWKCDSAKETAFGPAAEMAEDVAG